MSHMGIELKSLLQSVLSIRHWLLSWTLLPLHILEPYIPNQGMQQCRKTVLVHRY
ncbi:hypothetical protein WH5701_14056 [Synechococcus sp. WH 5701]|nr:hypothetical protein WH5701_14056 [Synechococcus sp. WH 5701]